ncbi:MAG: site-2 protease family protein [Planctomycetota bacterium]
MPFADPSPTPADISFRLFGMPIRIHPFFWLIAVLLAPFKQPYAVLIWAVAMLVSIVIHELGHALLQRYWGGQPRIVLYGFGGLAISDGVRITPWRQVAISLAGPFAGFILAAGVWLVGQGSFELPPTVNLLLQFMLLINIFWGIFNLLPIYPLDGGQVARELFTLVLKPETGIVVSLWVSIFFCAAAAAGLWLWTQSLWNLILMAGLGFNNYQTLEAYRNARRGYYRS